MSDSFDRPDVLEKVHRALQMVQRKLAPATGQPSFSHSSVARSSSTRVRGMGRVDKEKFRKVWIFILLC